MDGDALAVAHHALACCEAWEDRARIIGNCRAVDLGSIFLRFIEQNTPQHTMTTTQDRARELANERCSLLSDSMRRDLALLLAEFAEREKAKWIPCSERMPTKEDADKSGFVFVATLLPGDNYHIAGYDSVFIRQDGKYWMTIPPLPPTQQPTAE